MLVVPQKGKDEEVKAIFAKWGLNAVVIGWVTDDGIMRIKDGDEMVLSCRQGPDRPVPGLLPGRKGAGLLHSSCGNLTWEYCGSRKITRPSCAAADLAEYRQQRTDFTASMITWWG
jgi:hypothetical protein